MTVADQLDHVRKHGRKSKHLFAWKRGTYAWLESNLKPWRERVLACDHDTPQALRTVMECPGLGLVKGAFVLQFLGHDVACMDSRNATREELERDHWGLHGVKHGKAFERKLAEYIRYTTGRAEELWDTWCHEIASVYQLDAVEVSAIHSREICRDKRVKS